MLRQSSIRAPLGRSRARLGAQLLALALLSLSASSQDGAALYATHCARCHGTTGDGQGSETLDRPARSFAEGGFSFGDSEDAIVRTLTHGIPGSPMPAFGEALPEAERHALARHVATLMPPRTEVLEAHTLLDVVDHAVVVRGHLPPIAEGADAHPRGLLVGLVEGFCFEYAVDDMRLLGVRQGPLVKRSDWTGRGGTPLEPLGRVVWLNAGGRPGATWRHDADGAPLSASLSETDTHPDRAPRLVELLADADGAVWADLDERLSVVSSSFGPILRRTLVLKPRREGQLSFHQPLTADGVALGRWEQTDARSLRRRSAVARRRPDGAVEVLLLSAPVQAGTTEPDLSASVELRRDGAPTTLIVDVLITGAWQAGDGERILSELSS